MFRECAQKRRTTMSLKVCNDGDPPPNTPGGAHVCVSVLVHYPTVFDPCGSVPVRREPLRWSRVRTSPCRNQGCVYKDVLAVFLNGKWPLKMLSMEQWPSALSRATGGPWRRPNGQLPAARFSLRMGDLYLLRNPIWSRFDQSGFFYNKSWIFLYLKGPAKSSSAGQKSINVESTWTTSKVRFCAVVWRSRPPF